ncbi:DUF4270 domain-containing protein [Capnocytophaga periodontitidis]|jgi:hypothetical protein|uniref:DUF4270 domain-containing protein n=1 Tax=Capnocytophaga periodontitidis TaxID=2795027 RepID=A0ABS0SP58_9FLAO|nr:DUF4270 domain-containing protein [Capnocytophaga periodontitidis]MBI1647541.1 DUF4270 domain-containing protein [Capnocytophaga periodontitidis]MBI1668914.1 DUF4270 domain-containing protein [Capnocytophaga periodontitidis]
MNNTYKLLFSLTVLTLFSACSSDDFNEIDGALLKNPNYETSVFTPTISVNQIKQTAVQTNGLGGYLLGQYTQAPFGTKSATIVAQVGLSTAAPTFGSKTQALENSENKPENEKVTKAFLYIPFFNPNTSNSKATYSQNAEYQLDSIYGDKSASFRVEVKETNYFLSDIGTDLKAKVYYSNNTEVLTNLGSSIVSATTSATTISNKTITRFQFDDPKTTTDESKTVYDNLAPGLRIPLNTTFFQTKILDKEGSNELANVNDFKKYFKGIQISTSNFSKDVMMLLNIANAKIQLEYSYTAYVSGSTATKTQYSRYDLPLNGIALNLFNNAGESLTDTSKIYLSGALGQTASITISDTDIARIKSEKWLVTDASLFFYVDNSVTYTKTPDRLYIYNAQTGAVLADYQYDPTANNNQSSYSHLVHLGRLQKENGVGKYYQLRITNHILNMVTNNTTNVPLAIAIGSNIKQTAVGSYKSASGDGKIAKTALATPLGVVIKDIKLIINYTKVK